MTFKSLLQKMRGLFKKADQRSFQLPVNDMICIKDLAAEDNMIPRSDIVYLDISDDVDAIRRTVNKSHHRNFPVVDGNLDKVLGIVHLRDLLKGFENPTTFSMQKILRTPLLVSPTTKCSHIILRMKSTQTYLALVMDEYGGTDGLLSLRDVMEGLLLGQEDIPDTTHHAMERLANGHIIADGRVSLDDFTQEYGYNLQEGVQPFPDVETLAGLVMHLANDVPDRGEVIHHPSGILFEILEAGPRSVKKIKIHNVPTI